jgi:hypothetical protein
MVPMRATSDTGLLGQPIGCIGEAQDRRADQFRMVEHGGVAAAGSTAIVAPRTASA